MHKKIWFKIHLYLGLTAGIILMLVGVTGAILSFEKEILWLVNKNSFVVKQGALKLSEKELLYRFKKNNPTLEIRSITINSNSNNSTIINVASNLKGKAGRKGINYYINPYTVEILPSLKGESFFKFIENIHRRLVLGEVGKQLVGASVISLLLLLFSGVYIYWPRIKRAFFKSLTFNFKHKGRAFLSTMHSAIGMWIIPFYLLASLTGLYWSYDWYKKGLYSIMGVEKQKRNFKTSFKSNNSISLDEVQKALTMFREKIPSYETVNLNIEAKNGIYTLNYTDDTYISRTLKNKILLDIKNEKVVSHEKFKDKALNEKIMGSILSLHTGEYFGLFGQIFMFISSLLMALFTITGFLMYFKRVKKKKKE